MIDAANNTQNIAMVSVPCGGHLGFFITENREVLVKSWADKIAKEFFMLLNSEAEKGIVRDRGRNSSSSDADFVTNLSTPRAPDHQMPLTGGYEKSPIVTQTKLGHRRTSVRGALFGF